MKCNIQFHIGVQAPFNRAASCNPYQLFFLFIGGNKIFRKKQVSLDACHPSWGIAAHYFDYLYFGAFKVQLHIGSLDGHSGNHAATIACGQHIGWAETFTFAHIIRWGIVFYYGAAL